MAAPREHGCWLLLLLLLLLLPPNAPLHVRGRQSRLARHTKTGSFLRCIFICSTSAHVFGIDGEMDCPIRALERRTRPLSSWRMRGEEATAATSAAMGIFADGSVDDEPDRKRNRLLMAAATVLILRKRDRKPPPTLHRKPLELTWETRSGLFSANEFASRYRLDREQFQLLLDRMLAARPTYGDRTHPWSIDPRLKLGSALRYLAGGSYVDCADLHGQRRSSFYRHLEETLDLIMEVEQLSFPIDDDDGVADLKRRCSGRGPHGRGLFRSCLGHIDGIVLKIRKPRPGEVGNVADCYCERKKFWGLNAVAVCDDDRQFLYFAITSSPNTHDSTALDNSSLGRAMLHGRFTASCYLNGDRAYSSKPFVMTPHSQAALNTAEDTFDYYQSSSRMAIECSFGILVRTWGCLWRPVECSVRLAVKIFGACVRLHNIRRRARLRDVGAHWRDGPGCPADDDAVHVMHLNAFSDPAPPPQRCNTKEAVRAAIANRLHNEEGARRNYRRV